MATVVDVLNRIARHCSLQSPSSWITTNEDQFVEIRDDFLRETVDDLLDRVDWPSPISAQQIIAGTGVATYTLPANFRRFQRNPLSVYDEQLQTACVPVVTDGDWVDLLQSGIAGSERFYRLAGYPGNWTIEFEGAPSSNVILSYVTNNWMVTAGGVKGNMLTADTDELLLPDRLVEVGTSGGRQLECICLQHKLGC